MPDAATGRSLLEADWLETSYGSRLHYADLTDEQCAELVSDSGTDDVTLTCGRRSARAWIPGFGARLTGVRCVRCCRATGLPPGVGSPKNDPACAVVDPPTKEDSQP